MKDQVGGDRYSMMTEINMIPFIDVALVLLIIFMILAPALVRAQINVTLPQAETAEMSRDDEGVIIVQIDRSGETWVQGKRVVVSELQAALTALLTGGGQHLVVFEADKNVAFEHVVHAMDAAKSGGAAKMAVSVRRE